MKRYLPLLLLTASLLAVSPTPAADTTDQMVSKVVGAGKPQPSYDPKAIASNALVSQDNTIALSAWGGNLRHPSNAPFSASKYTDLQFTAPTAARVITIPDVSGTLQISQASTTVALTADNQVVTPGKANVIQLTSDNATATSRTFTLSATGAITGQVYYLIGPATNQCEITDTGIQVLSATWSPTTGDSLALLFNGTNFIELTRANN